MRYTIEIEENDNKWSASVLELPGCDKAKNFDHCEEAVNKIRENIEQHITKLDDEAAAFSLVYSEEYQKYYYTLDDKRNKLPELKHRFGWISFFVVIVIGLSILISWPIVKYTEETIFSCLLQTSSIFASLLATIWAIQSYWRLRYIDKQTEKWRPHGPTNLNKNKDDWSDPLTFHVLAESHKEWAELWFSWCVAIFSGGVTYAIFIYHKTEIADAGLSWQFAIYNIIREQAPNSFIYLLFGVVWYWASKHYRSHWHNFVINAYRHRALYRFEQLRNDIKKNENKLFSNQKAEATILELYRLSGILLLIQGDSSYLDKVGSEEASKAILQMEEFAKAFTDHDSK